LGGVREHGLGAWDMCIGSVSFWLLKTHMFAILIFEDSTFISTLFFRKFFIMMYIEHMEKEQLTPFKA